MRGSCSWLVVQGGIILETIQGGIILRRGGGGGVVIVLGGIS